MIFTIGHSTHPIERFLSLLSQHRIAAIADVRSAPFSRRNPQFSRHNLTRHLHNAAIQYVFLGKELGARSQDESCYANGKVQYHRLAATRIFQQGIAALQQQAQQYRTAILCAEQEPLECHRTILVSQHLNIPVLHIHADGRLEPHEQAIQRLIRRLRLPPPDMFRTRGDIVAEAYRMQGERIAYTRPSAQNDIMGA